MVVVVLAVAVAVVQRQGILAGCIGIGALCSLACAFMAEQVCVLVGCRAQRLYAVHVIHNLQLGQLLVCWLTLCLLACALQLLSLWCRTRLLAGWFWTSRAVAHVIASSVVVRAACSFP